MNNRFIRRTVFKTVHDEIGPPPKIETEPKKEGLTCKVLRKKK